MKNKQKYYCIKCGNEMDIEYEYLTKDEGRLYWSETNNLFCKCGYEGSEYKLKNSLFDTILMKTNGSLFDFNTVEFKYGVPMRITKRGNKKYVEGLKNHPHWGELK